MPDPTQIGNVGTYEKVNLVPSGQIKMVIAELVQSANQVRLMIAGIVRVLISMVVRVRTAQIQMVHVVAQFVPAPRCAPGVENVVSSAFGYFPFVLVLRC